MEKCGFVSLLCSRIPDSSAVLLSPNEGKHGDHLESGTFLVLRKIACAACPVHDALTGLRAAPRLVPCNQRSSQAQGLALLCSQQAGSCAWNGFLLLLQRLIARLSRPMLPSWWSVEVFYWLVKTKL